MTKQEFSAVIAYITAAIGKPLQHDSITVYYDLLGDLPLDVLQVAAKRVCLEHKWASFPTVAELRQAAATTIQGQVTQISPGEAWEMAWNAVSVIDPEVSGSVQRGLSGMPDIVVRAIRAYGLNALCYGQEPLGVIRAQFTKIFENLVTRQQREALLPAPLKQAIEAMGERYPQLTGQLAQTLSLIGVEDDADPPVPLPPSRAGVENDGRRHSG